MITRNSNFSNPLSPVYIVQECGSLKGWKKFIHLEKMETLLCKRTILAVYNGEEFIQKKSCEISQLQSYNYLSFQSILLSGYPNPLEKKIFIAVLDELEHAKKIKKVVKMSTFWDAPPPQLWKFTTFFFFSNESFPK